MTNGVMMLQSSRQEHAIGRRSPCLAYELDIFAPNGYGVIRFAVKDTDAT